MTQLDAGEYERAISWNLTIAAELIGKDTPYRDEGKERCWGSFHVCRQTGLWHDWAASDGGVSSIALIRFLKKRAGEKWSAEDAIKWLVKFLAEHEGLGRLEAEDEDWTATRQAATAELARHYIEVAEPWLEDSVEVVYLTGRALLVPIPRRCAGYRTQGLANPLFLCRSSLTAA